ncbi:hypothetical protein GCM10025859_29050 [Alicyclobacillus fastidiosus]|nr:hypothetical protein GCM10025859_29050 [Alicyclobacillus fastidiosus]
MTLMPYRNEPPIDWTTAPYKEQLQKALAEVKEQFGKTYPLYIDGQEIATKDALKSVNPANHQEIVGYVSQATREHIDQAVAAASRAFKTWRHTTFEERAMYLMKAAQIMRKRKAELMAWQIYESGKTGPRRTATCAKPSTFSSSTRARPSSWGKAPRSPRILEKTTGCFICRSAWVSSFHLGTSRLPS